MAYSGSDGGHGRPDSGPSNRDPTLPSWTLLWPSDNQPSLEQPQDRSLLSCPNSEILTGRPLTQSSHFLAIGQLANVLVKHKFFCNPDRFRLHPLCRQLNATPLVKGPGNGDWSKHCPLRRAPPSWRKPANTQVDLAEPLGSLSFSFPTWGAEKLDRMTYKSSSILWFLYPCFNSKPNLILTWPFSKTTQNKGSLPGDSLLSATHIRKAMLLLFAAVKGQRLFQKPQHELLGPPRGKNPIGLIIMLHETYDLKAFLPENNKQ